MWKIKAKRATLSQSTSIENSSGSTSCDGVLMRVSRCCLGVLAILWTGCGDFGLPAYVPPETNLPHSTGAAILEVDPKFGRQGDAELELNIYGLNTSFSNASVVTFPDEPEIQVTGLYAEDVEWLIVTVDISKRAATGVTSLMVKTEHDGEMTYREGFTVLE